MSRHVMSCHVISPDHHSDGASELPREQGRLHGRVSRNGRRGTGETTTTDKLNH